MQLAVFPVVLVVDDDRVQGAAIWTLDPGDFRDLPDLRLV